MARDGSGGYNLPEAAFVFDTVIEETKVNNNFSDLGTEIANSIAKDGQTTVTANLPMNSKKHTGVADATARTEYAAAGQITDGELVFGGTAAGTADALTISLSPAVTALVEGMRFAFKASASPNTGAATIAINGLTPVALELNDTALSANDILANKWYEGLFDGTAVQIQKLSFTPGDLIDPLTTRGDIIVRDASATTRLAIGAADRVLSSDGTDPSYTQVSTGMLADNAVTGAKIAMGSDAAGDVIYYNGTDYVRLAIGTAGQALLVNSGATAPEWGSAGVFSESFTSSDQTITLAGSLTIAHSLSAAPQLIQVRLKCTTANLNYSVNDEVIFSAMDTNASSSGFSIVPDSTNLNVRIGNTAPFILDKSTGVGNSITTTSWRLIIKAWA